MTMYLEQCFRPAPSITRMHSLHSLLLTATCLLYNSIPLNKPKRKIRNIKTDHDKRRLSKRLTKSKLLVDEIFCKLYNCLIILLLTFFSKGSESHLRILNSKTTVLSKGIGIFRYTFFSIGKFHRS